MNQLNIKQVHKRLLDVARAVDCICQKHDIPLFMISGTMLGAIRHEGFIPWDDDMDFAVPYEMFPQLMDFLEKELPENMLCIIFDHSTTYQVPWIKVEDCQSLVIDHCLDVPKEQMPGLTIDIFPLVQCERSISWKVVEKIQRLLKLQRVAFAITPGNKRMQNIVKKIIRFFIPISAKGINERIIKLMDSIKPGDSYTIPVDPNYYNCYFPKDWFSPLTKYRFEEYEFYGLSNYDGYLTEIYQDYLQLPPEEKRRIHCDSVYLR